MRESFTINPIENYFELRSTSTEKKIKVEPNSSKYLWVKSLESNRIINITETGRWTSNKDYLNDYKLIEPIANRKKEHQSAWNSISNKFSIDKSIGEVNIVKKIIELADGVQTQICEYTDKYKIEIFNQIKEEYPNIELSKEAWIEVVNLRRMKKFNKIGLKTIKKIEDSFNKDAYNIAIKSANLHHFTKDTIEPSIKLPVIDRSADVQIENFKFEQYSKEFMELIDISADIQHHIKENLYPELEKLSKAFCWITSLTGKEFKTLVDVTHYRYGGFPTKDTPPRHWSIFKKYREINLLMERFDFDHASMWNLRFGITSIFTEHPHFTWNIFTKEAEDWKDINVWKPTLSYFSKNHENLRKFNIDAWHIIAQVENTCFVINETNCEIISHFNINDLQNVLGKLEITTNYLDFIKRDLIFSEKASKQTISISKIKLSKVLY